MRRIGRGDLDAVSDGKQNAKHDGSLHILNDIEALYENSWILWSLLAKSSELTR